MNDEAWKPEVTGTTYGVELLFEVARDPGDPALASALSVALPRAHVEGGKSLCTIFHEDVRVRFQDGDMPAQTVILPTEVVPEIARLEPALQQTRDWPEARDVASKARCQWLVTDMMTGPLEQGPRLAVFQRTLAHVVEATKPLAIHWAPANKLVEPERLVRALKGGDELELLLLALNVRLFNVGNRPGEMVMDTVGLAALGLVDLQVHFHRLDPNDVARHLFNCAKYVFDAGDVIQDGHTLQGLDPSQKWRCQHEASLVGPARIVLDLDPGPPFAAGR